MALNDVSKLREETGAGVMDCKRALEAAKKEERTTGAGHLELYLHSGRVGVMLELRAETDFVTRSEQFKELAKNVAMHIAAMNPQTIEELLAQPYVKDESQTIENVIKAVIGKIGENIRVERFARYQI